MEETEIMQQFLATLPDSRKAAIALAWLDYNRYTMGPKMIPYSYADEDLLVDEFEDNQYEIAEYVLSHSSALTQDEWDTAMKLIG